MQATLGHPLIQDSNFLYRRDDPSATSLVMFQFESLYPLAFGYRRLATVSSCAALTLGTTVNCMHPAPWEPPSPLQQRLRCLARRRVALDDMRVQESNRLGAPGSSDVRSSIEATLSFLDRQIDEIEVQIRSIIDDDPTLRGKRELLTSIPGIGERLAVGTPIFTPAGPQFRAALTGTH